MDGSGEKIKT